MRTLAGIGTALLLTAAAPAQETAREQAGGGGGGVCARFAPQLGLKQRPAGRGGGAGEWRVNMVGGLGATLFGGSGGATFGASPLDGDDDAATRNFARMCAQEGADIMCRVEGPAHLEVGTKRGQAGVDIAPGERVEIGTRGRNLVCRDNA